MSQSNRLFWVLRVVLLATVIIAFNMSLPSDSAAAPTFPWTNGLYVYRNGNRSVPGVLKDFSEEFNIRLSISSRVSGTFDGVIRSNSPTQFLNDLASIYGFDWFYYDGVLHVTSNTERLTRIVSVRRTNMKGIRDTLRSVGLLADRFGWSEVPDQDLIVISGPRSYIDITEGLIKRFNVGPEDTEIAIVRLHYATASDVSLPGQEKTVVPGVVSVLNRLVKEGGITKSEDIKEKITEQEAAILSSQEVRRVVSVQADDRLNAVIIRAPRFLMGLYKSLVAKLDVATDLVEIGAVVVDVSLGKSRQLGIDWAAGSDKFSVGYGLGPESMKGAGFQGPQSGKFNLAGLPFGSSSFAFDTGYFLSRLKLLEEMGDAQTVSRPSILMMDNMTAAYDSSRTFYILNGPAQTSATKQVSAGLRLKVKPRVVRSQEGLFVQMWLDIHDGGFDEKDRGVQGYPVIRNHSVSTILMLGEGESTLIAGDQYDYSTQKNGGIPYLKDIPLVGALFSNRTSEVTKRQRFFLLTPRVITIKDLLAAGKDRFGLTARIDQLPRGLRGANVDDSIRSVSSSYRPDKRDGLRPHNAGHSRRRQAYLPDENETLPIDPKKQASRNASYFTGPVRHTSSPSVLLREDGAVL